ncbi:hypothetical protein GGI43DRAFT_351433 [Trichoderma evansii]
MTAAVSASPAADNSATGIGVTFYKNIKYKGDSYTVPSFKQCWRLPDKLHFEASSVHIREGISCGLFGDDCRAPALWKGLRESEEDLEDLYLDDKVASVICAAIGVRD